MTEAEAHRVIFDQVSLYGLTNVPAAARVACDNDRRQATWMLEDLVRSSELFRYGTVYTTSPERPKARDRWRSLSVLSYCCLGNHPRPRVPQERLADALQSISNRLGVRPPVEKPCIFDRDNKLVRLWVEPHTDDPAGLDLGDLLAALQRATRDKSFVLWSYLALSGEFAMQVLCRSRARADELGLWLDRAPLVGRAGSEAVEILATTAVIQ